ncbi:general secretion pathway protein GspB [Janthinobacterium psychrotolerans]|uniref:General secretion pathway protein B n=1 Tax=Janthinobacterium psychrotolerans TaxID=1747903 RepID=A0A1A7C2R2_9BURK|nr:general secretion pathway protein GspB [Janthinobacterium psychrotolerans]OBV39304.1 general secretion pathway protein B [Janthinobacterium psychrotolerans]
MSYILEALKKSQAERQLGELPSIHAPQVQLQPAASTRAAPRWPLWLGLSLACAAAGAWWWQAKTVAAPAPAPVPVPAAAPVAVAPVPVPVVPPAPVVVKAAPPVIKAAPPAPMVKAVTPPPAPAVATAPAEEATPGLRDLPEPIQRQIPPVALGGYIYSKDPADRLLLIDKVLRHEGEEVAPGLVLEKLQPKAAIFSFKGYRYRMPY